MTRRYARLLLGGIFVLGSTAMIAPEASAQASRTWVSGVGDDNNNCSRTAPCKTFAMAITKTNAGGKINCLDPAGFGAVTITKSITIQCDSNEAGVLVSGSSGITINDGGAGTAQVTISGLDIDGQGYSASAPGARGIWFLSGASLTVRNTTVRGFRSSTTGTGINFMPSTSARLLIDNVIVSGNGNGTVGGGIAIQSAASAAVEVTIVDSTVVHNEGWAVAFRTTGTTGAVSRLTVRNTIVNSNSAGLLVVTGAGPTGKAIANVTNSTFNQNETIGVRANGAVASIWLSGNSVSGNAEGLKVTGGGAIYSFGDNVVFDNTVSAAPTAWTKQ